MWELIRANRRRSVWLFVLLIITTVVTGAACGYVWVQTYDGAIIGAAFAAVFSLVLCILAATRSSQFVLKLSDALPVEPELHPVLHNVVDEMVIASGGGPKPKVYVTFDSAPNAFATGQREDDAAVVVTTGLLQSLTRPQLQGVIAHELAHIRNYDVRFLTYASVMLGTLGLLSDTLLRGLWLRGGRRRGGSNRIKSNNTDGGPWLLVLALIVAVVGPIIARMLYFAISRRREYLADACAVQYTRDPESLAGALQTLSGSSGDLKACNRLTSAMFIVNPAMQLQGKPEAVGLKGLDSTHPPIGQRIAILNKLAGAEHVSPKLYQRAFLQVTGQRSYLWGGADAKLSAHNNAAIYGEAPITHSATSSAVVGLCGLSDETGHEALDFVRAAHGYAAITCSCSLRLKIPPTYNKPHIECPRCGTKHDVPGNENNDVSIPSAAHQTFHATIQGNSWQSLDCQGCHRMMQISPGLTTDRIRCRHCQATTVLARSE